MTLMLIMLGDCIGFKSIRKLKKQKLYKMDTDESKSAQI